MNWSAGIIVMSMLVSAASAEVIGKPVEYSHGDAKLEGFIAYDDKVEGPRPGVLIVHEWWGLTERNRVIAKRLAEMGYVAMAVDMYGKGVVTENADEARKLSGQFGGDRKLMRERAAAAYDVLIANERVDKSRIAAIGYCFGGTTCLQMAYSGLKLAGVVSFHGSLTPPTDADMANIKAKILVLHGADDALVPADTIQKFQESMRKAGADWQMMYYGGAVHSFTNPDAAKAGFDSVKYHAKSDERSWTHMKVFFDEIFAAIKEKN